MVGILARRFSAEQQLQTFFRNLARWHQVTVNVKALRVRPVPAASMVRMN
jgi:hypothetical protein